MRIMTCIRAEELSTTHKITNSLSPLHKLSPIVLHNAENAVAQRQQRHNDSLEPGGPEQQDALG